LEKVGSRAFQNARLQKQYKKQAETLFPAAVAAYRQGRRAEVQSLCRRILEGLPDHSDTLHLLGVSELDGGRIGEAERVLARAAALAPKSAEVHANLGLALFNLRRFDDARRHLETAIRLNPKFAVALSNLGNTLMHLRQLEQAVEAQDRAIALKPDYSDAYCSRGMAQLLLGRHEDAIESFDRVLSFNPRHMQATFGKGMVAFNQRHTEQAEAAFNTALAINPRAAAVLTQRGRLYLQTGNIAKAEADFEAAVAIEPGREAAWCGKAHVNVLAGSLMQAIFACQKALELNPSSEVALTWLGACFAKQGDISAAIEHYDRALAISPDYEDAHTKKIFALGFAAEADFAVHRAARRNWWEAVGANIIQRKLKPSNLDPERRIVVGYVSSDFRDHSAALAFLPILQHHDHRNFEIVCYSCSPLHDAITEACRLASDSWCDASKMSDDQLADRIEADHVDILVDLSGHSAGNRLTVFARKPAPIQVTAFGDAIGTGLPTMDYVFQNPVGIPISVRHLLTEQVYDLPCVITMAPVIDRRPSPAPMIRNGFVTFGVFNRIEKISDRALELWSRLLTDLPGSKIVMKNGALDDAFLRDALVARFVANGVSSDRVTCLGSSRRNEHLAAFANVDISLDPFPQNGGISTLESLYTGVPVVARLGNAAAARGSASILKAIGLDDWVAEDDESYLAIARKYASLPSEVEALRAELPDRMTNSPIGNLKTYTSKVEEGYRRFWRDYCGAGHAGTVSP
jgi:predicted O-linked N-acetylglucosamine transferase (SPINDLY family)